MDNLEELMIQIEEGDEGRPEISLTDHSLWEDEMEYSKIASVDMAYDTELGIALWTVSTPSGFVADGESKEYADCVYCGAEHEIRSDCLHDRNEALGFVRSILLEKKSDLRVVSVKLALNLD